MSQSYINKLQCGNGIWTEDSLIAGNNISITKVQKPVIDENTVLLFHGDSITDDYFVDSIQGATFSDYNHPFSLSTYHKFGTNSMDLGQSGFNPRPRFADFGDFTVNSFTVEFWFYNEAGKYPRWTVHLQQYNSSYGISPYYWFSANANDISTLTAGAYTSSGSTEIKKASNIIDHSVAGWHHFAGCFDSDTNMLYCFIDGLLVSSGTVLNFNTKYLAMAGRGQYDYSSYFTTIIDEVRVSNACRWTSDFTPFDQPYATAGGVTEYQINAISSASSGPTTKSFANSTGTTLATGLTLADYSTIFVYKNGLLLTEDESGVENDYSISSNNIEFNDALETTDRVNLICF